MLTLKNLLKKRLTMDSDHLYTVFSKNNCSYCVRAIELIRSNNFQVVVKKIDESDEFFAEMRKLAPLMRTMPVILKDDQLVGGYSDLLKLFNAE